MLYKKIVVIWAATEDDLNDAAIQAVAAARESGNAVAFGIMKPDYAVAEPEKDPDYCPAVDDLPPFEPEEEEEVDLRSQRKQAADRVLSEYNFAPKLFVTGHVWRDVRKNPDAMICMVWVRDEAWKRDTIHFQVNFKQGTAEPESWSIVQKGKKAS
jgi:hypothetical protein